MSDIYAAVENLSPLIVATILWFENIQNKLYSGVQNVANMLASANLIFVWHMNIEQV